MWKRVGDKQFDNGWWVLITGPLVMVLLLVFFLGGCDDQAHGASWGPRGCGPVGPSVQYQQAPLEWHYPADWKTSGIACLYRGRAYVGTYNYFTGLYTPAAGQPYHPEGWPVWEKKTPAKCACNKGCRCDAGLCQCKSGYLCSDDCTCAGEKTAAPRQDFGCLWEPNSKKSERVFLTDQHGTRELSKAQAREAIQNGVPDDRHKLRLTVIGTEVERKRVLADLAPWQDKLLVQAYEPTHWAVRDAGFSTKGSPTIYVQGPDGTVLHRQDDYNDGAAGLATAIRKADPNYRPEKDPDLRKTPAPPQPSPLSPPTWPAQVWAFFAAVFVAVGDTVIAMRKALVQA